MSDDQLKTVRAKPFVDEMADTIRYVKLLKELEDAHHITDADKFSHHQNEVERLRRRVAILQTHDAARDEALVEGLAKWIFIHDQNWWAREGYAKEEWEKQTKKEKNEWRNKARAAIKAARGEQP